MKYSDKLKDKRWHKKAYDIKERDNNTCQVCGSKDNLHAHHILYQFDLDPWDYVDEALITLCKDCHKHEHKCKDKINNLMFNAGYSGMLHSDILKKLKPIFNFD